MEKQKLQIETTCYNPRRYGKPWIAKVTFENGGKGEFEFGEWIGQIGEEGLLEIVANTGDIIARGQKDFRKPRNSAPDYYVLGENGNLSGISKADAYKSYKSKNA